jgi:branched-chain amino acid transport system substrate-binding protein
MNVEFVEAFRKAHNEAPDKGAALGAAALEVWATAAGTAKSLDRKTVAGAIRGEKVGGTILGELAFADTGQAQHKHTIFKVVDGKSAKIAVVP